MSPTLPVTRKGQSGKVLLCPQQDYPATSVANFCTAVLTPIMVLSVAGLPRKWVHKKMVMGRGHLGIDQSGIT